MKQYPKNFKYKNVYRKKFKNISNKVYKKINYEFYGLRILKEGFFTYKQIEAGSKLLKKMFKKDINIRINGSCIFFKSEKPMGSRMGKGKGKKGEWVFPIHKGMILYEFSGVEFKELFAALKQVQRKIPFKCKIVKVLY